MPATHLNAKDSATMERIYRQPLPSDLDWHDVVVLVGKLGTVKEDGSRLTLTIKDASHHFHRPESGDLVDDAQIHELRRLLRDAGIGRLDPKEVGDGEKLAVVVTQKEARIFDIEDSHVAPVRIASEGAHGRPRDESGDVTARFPESVEYYEAIAEALQGAGGILLLGGGEGGGSAMEHFKEFLEARHARLAARIVGTRVVDASSLADGAVRDMAREVFSLPG